VVIGGASPDIPSGCVVGLLRRTHHRPEESHMPQAQTTANKAAFSRFDDAVNSGDMEIISKMIDEAVAPDVLFHAPVPTGETGVPALKQVWEVLLRAFPDLHVAVEDVIAEGDKVVARQTVTGTHQGEFSGLPPTGKSITYNEIFIFRFADGQIAEIWGVVDVLSPMKQLGMIPLPLKREPPRPGRRGQGNWLGHESGAGYGRGLGDELPYGLDVVGRNAVGGYGADHESCP
jgi:steroid delta-isomerase-like uncharacterized protein